MSTILCPNCDHANSPNSKFCSNCGHRLPPSTQIICPNCQTPNPRNLFYCDHCGARLVKETLPTEVESDPGLDDELEQPSVHPTDLFSLPIRKPGDTGKLDLNTLPDWLRKGGQKEEGETADEEPPESSEADETPPRKSNTDELPDWLVTDSSVELYQLPDEITTEAYLQMAKDAPPELLDATDFNNDLNLPDWLTDAVRDTDSLKEKKPAEPQPDEARELPNPFETSTNIPEWLAEVGGLTRNTAPTPDEEEDEEIPTVEEWGFSQSDDDDTLDWLVDSETETAESKVQPEAAPDLSGLQEWGTAVAPSANIPDWYHELARPNREKLGNWLLELEELPEPEFLIDQPEASSVADRLTDWLSEADEPATPDTGDTMVTGMLTGWLSELDEDNQADYQDDEEESEKQIVTGRLTGWLAELDEDEPESDLFPGWLTDDETLDEPGLLDEPVEEEELGPDTFTSWLDDDEATDFDFLIETPDTDPSTDWLASDEALDEPDLLDEPVDKEAPEPDPFTGWLDDDEAADFDFLTEAPDTDHITGWLAGDDTLDEPDLLDEPVDEEVPEPDPFTGWLSNASEDDESDFLAEAPDKEQFTSWPADDDESDQLDLVEETEFREEKEATGMLTGWLAELDQEEEADFVDDEGAEVSEKRAVTGMLTGWLAELDQEDADFLDDEEVEEELEPGIVTDWLPDLDTVDGKDFAGVDEIDESTSWVEPTVAEQAEPSQVPPLPAAPEEPSTGPLTEAEESEVSPDWLTDLRQVEGQDKERQSSLVQEDLPDWLSNMKPSADTEGSSMPDFDLDVDLSDDFAEIPLELSGADLPDWLQDISPSSRSREGATGSAEHGSEISDWLRPGDGEQSRQQDSSGQLRSILSELPPPRDPREALAKADIPEWVDALKPKALTGGQQPMPATPVPESGPLLGIPGVIEIAPVIAASHVVHEAPVTQLTITPEQQQQAELLQQLAQGELLLSETAASPRRRLAWGRFFLSLILLALMSAAIILDTPLSLVREDVMPAPASIEAAQTAMTEAASQPVLIAFDYTPAFEGELAPEAAALMRQLAANGSPIIAVSQSAAGTAIAATYTDDQTLFIPGEAIGLRQLGFCMANECNALFGRSLENDLSQIGLIIVLTGERKSLVNWIEQVGPQSNAPMLAATTESLEPVAMSYVSSGQLEGTLSHLAALGRYEDTLPAATADAAQQRALNAQMLVQLLLVVLLLLGLVGQLGRTIMGRRNR